MEVYSQGYAKVANNIFENNNDNNSGGSGAGMSLFTYDNAVAVVEHNLFKENTAGNSAGFNVNAQGDENAVSEYGSQVTVIDNQFYKNTATSPYSGGAGMRLTAEDGAVVTAKNNVIYNNTGYSGGGVVLCSKDTSQIVFSNNLIHENEARGSWAGGGGGSLDSYNSGEIEFSNNTVTANVAPFSGGGLDIHQHDNGTINIIDSIIWGNSISGTLAFGENLYIGGDSVSSVTLSYCLFNEAYPSAGWTDGGHNITGDTIDPLFVTGSLGDYYLSQEGAGQAETSPCVDAGSDTAANLGLDHMTTRTDEVSDSGIVDIGYHYPAGMVQPVPGDADGDGDVDGTDLSGFAAAYGSSPADSSYVDAFVLDETPGIDDGDLAIFAERFGKDGS
ncbi:MAG: hypothetical protein DRG83_19565 [Deltaproteobacteria bacterium]|nr:MAG: hypothetical protein DRG83_19565 [Deltaproteobacteria bacterium]